MEQTTCSDHPKIQLAGLTTPTDSRYKPGNVVIMGSHLKKERPTMKQEQDETLTGPTQGGQAQNRLYGQSF